MKNLRWPFMLTTLTCLCLLTSCALFEDDSSSESDEPEIMEVSGSEDLTGFSNESEILPDRPANAWTPVKNLNFPTVYFAFDQSGIGTTQVKKLESVASYLEKHPKLGLIIEGHCDERGSGEYNIGLGERRALSVRDYLKTLGLPAKRMQTISYGSERPAVNGHDHSTWSKNRRVELIPARMGK